MKFYHNTISFLKNIHKKHPMSVDDKTHEDYRKYICVQDKNLFHWIKFVMKNAALSLTKKNNKKNRLLMKIFLITSALS